MSLNKKSNTKIGMGLLFLVFCTVAAFADSFGENSASIAGNVTSTPTTYVLSQLTTDTFSHLASDQQKNIANVWHLTTDDYAHYLQLMNQTPNGFYYQDKHLDPSWILGFNARDEKERQKYVKIAIQNERERIEKELAFQRDFTNLQKQFYPDQKPITEFFYK